MVCNTSIFDSPTASRIMLSATAFTASSGLLTLKRKSGALPGLMRHCTEKLISTMFSSPVSIRLSSGTVIGAPPEERMPISMLVMFVTAGVSAVSIG